MRRIFRLTHLYVGVFIAPALLFFALTGALQTFGLHETNRDHPNYHPARWIVVLAQLHKKQVAAVPQRRPPAATTQAAPSQPDAAAAAGSHPHRDHSADGDKPAAAIEATPAPASAVAAKTPEPTGRKHNPLPLRIFFLIVCVGLFTSTATGIYMSYQYTRSRLWVTVALAAGIIVPLLLLIP